MKRIAILIPLVILAAFVVNLEAKVYRLEQTVNGLIFRQADFATLLADASDLIDQHSQQLKKLEPEAKGGKR